MTNNDKEQSWSDNEIIITNSATPQRNVTVNKTYALSWHDLCHSRQHSLIDTSNSRENIHSVKIMLPADLTSASWSLCIFCFSSSLSSPSSTNCCFLSWLACTSSSRSSATWASSSDTTYTHVYTSVMPLDFCENNWKSMCACRLTENEHKKRQKVQKEKDKTEKTENGETDQRRTDRAKNNRKKRKIMENWHPWYICQNIYTDTFVSEYTHKDTYPQLAPLHQCLFTACLSGIQLYHHLYTHWHIHMKSIQT